MAGIIINVTTRRLDEEEFIDVMEQLFDYIVAISPVDTGYFASQWEIDVDYPDATIYNDTDYGEYLDEGWSKQAPNGISKPAEIFLRKLINGYA